MSNEAINAAFPVPHFTRPDGDIEWGSFGLTKLEYGALKIAAAMCKAGDIWPDPSDRHEIARRAVLIASAVLTEASK